MAEPYVQLASCEEGQDTLRPAARGGAAKMVVTSMLMAFGTVAVYLGQASHGQGLLLAGSPVRTFKYFTEEDAKKLLLEGVNNNELVLEEGMVKTLQDSVNLAVLRIRSVLLASGQPEAPFVTQAPPDLPKLGKEVFGEDAQWWVPRDAHKGVYKLAMLGGVCGGKTTGLHYLQAALPSKNLLTVAVPEVATVLFQLGVMNYGSHVPYTGKENEEFMVQQLIVQLVLEELFGRAAEKLLAMHPQSRAVVMLTDRDATGGKVFSSPLVPSIDVWWPDVLARAGWLLGSPIADRDLTSRYQLGAVVLQTRAVVNGRLNPENYEEKCLGSDGTNAVRSETAEAAQADDEAVTEACAEAYSPEDICRVPTLLLGDAGDDEKNQHLLSCVLERIDTLHPQ